MRAGSPGVVLSFSAAAAYDECPRRYALRTLSDYLPTPRRWEVKLQARLAPWTTVVGKLVDETIAAALRQYRQEREWPDDLYGSAMARASEWWRCSRQWLQEGRRGQAGPLPRTWQPLDRHYYEEAITPAEIASVRERVRVCLENWQGSELREWIAGFERSSWHGLREPGERIEQFVLDGVPIWAAPNFALRTAAGTWILDWKCGQPSTAAYLRTRDQLLWYGLLACREWGAVPETLQLVAVWLWPEYRRVELDVTPAELEDAALRIRERHRLLSALLHLRAAGEAPLELWPVTENVALCRSCSFRGSCEGAARLHGSVPAELGDDPFSTD